ncbi:uncharacterized protein [Clytia hemisphaerica]|uniref:uncharacterized protein n=1 Tax=Clytia hemisphaerica TaxID=252671 RepID=UPI0034D515D5
MLTSDTTTTAITEWKSSRRRTFILFCFFTSVIGTEYSIVTPSLLTYLQDVIKVENEAAWFAAIVSIYWLSSMVGSMFITKYADRSRNIRQCCTVVFIIASLGNFVYAVPYSPVFPLVGRMLQGFGDSLISVITGEVVRVYPEDEVLSKVSILISNYYVTFILGPVLSLMFSRINFRFMDIPFTVTNLPNLILGFVWLLCILLNLTCVRNLSKEYDLKSEQQTVEKELRKIEEEKRFLENHTEVSYGTIEKFVVLIPPKQIDGKSQHFSTKVTISTIKSYENSSDVSITRFLRLKEFRVILIINFLCAYISVAFFDVALPFLCTKLYEMKLEMTGVLFSTTGLAFVVTLIFILRRMKFMKNEIIFIIVGMSMFIVALQSMSISIMVRDVRPLGYAFLALYSILFGISWSVEQVLLGVIVAKMIPSNHQSYAEGIRRSVSSIAYVAAGCVTPLLTGYLVEQLIIISLFLFLSVFYLFMSDLKFQRI